MQLEGRGDARRADYLEKMGYEEIGIGRKYESVVFKAKRSKQGCCPWEMASATGLDMRGYNNPDQAMRGHYQLCDKWSKGKE
jgi:hypothetical protein